MNGSELNRRVKIGLSADGVVFMIDSDELSAEARQEKAEFARYALPVYSTDTRAEAESIVARRCKLRLDGRYQWPGVFGDVDVLDEVAAEMARLHNARP